MRALIVGPMFLHAQVVASYGDLVHRSGLFTVVTGNFCEFAVSSAVPPPLAGAATSGFT